VKTLFQTHLIALGANGGPSRAANARAGVLALSRLRRWLGPGLRASRLYATPAWPRGAGPEFVNAVARIDSALPPAAMLALLHRVEARAGRVRGVRWGMRVLDLDLLAVGSLVRPDDVAQTFWRRLPEAEQRRRAPDRLILPHPRLQDRAFVLIPLAEVAPGWRHPLTGRRVAEMAAALPAAARREVRPLAPVTRAGLVKPRILH
jgi:2-amino-4-hydroxy-6-hydroxymethyldihydropteridine diphosphokinase